MYFSVEQITKIRKIGLQALLLFCFMTTFVTAQPIATYQSFAHDSSGVIRQRAALSGALLAGSVGVIALSIDEAYYQDKRVKFHFARDRNGSLTWFENRHRAMDKFGHIFSTSLFSENIYFLSRWSGYSNKTASITAASLSIALLGAMEVWDAHFQRWGFSIGDFIANIAGGLYPVAQQNIDFLQATDYKMSYNFIRTKSPDHGIHDYENMTFWLTVNPRAALPSDYLNWFPNWLNIALGVGLDSYQSQRREIYIGLDFNLKRIRSRFILLRHLIAVLDRFHFPAPAIRLAPGFIGYGLYF